jgi:hypothetical protein
MLTDLEGELQGDSPDESEKREGRAASDWDWSVKSRLPFVVRHLIVAVSPAP